MLAKKFNAMFFLCIMGTEEVHRGTQRFDKSTRICFGLIYPHSDSGINRSITVESSAQIGLETTD